ncbi:preprotein translocase subunit SecG [Alphaproteobacteria bacterium]|nr:preprotein translocase subunit SecG [Alphaproteobacteria bacterium]
MEKVILVVHIISAISLVGIILLQKSEGGALSGLGGGDPSAGVFSTKGTANALTRITALLAVIFMVTALLMASISNKSISSNILEKVTQPVEQTDGEVPLAE